MASRCRVIGKPRACLFDEARSGPIERDQDRSRIGRTPARMTRAVSAVYDCTAFLSISMIFCAKLLSSSAMAIFWVARASACCITIA
jgi:hypothetical protein